MVLAAVAVIAVLAVSAPSDAAPSTEEGIPVPFVDFEITLGYEEMNYRVGDPTLHPEYEMSDPCVFADMDYNYLAQVDYWTLSVDFSKSVIGTGPLGQRAVAYNEPAYYWPYGNDAYMKVTFFFNKEGGSADPNGSWYGVPDLVSRSINVPVFEVDGMPYVNDVLCTPLLWPTEEGVSVYPVYAEAMLLYKMNTCPDTASNKCQILGWANDYAAFEYVVKYFDTETEAPVIDKDTNQIVPYNYGWMDWGITLDNGAMVRNWVTVPAQYHHYNPAFVYGESEWYEQYILDGIPGYNLVIDDEIEEGLYKSVRPIETPALAPFEYMGLSFSELMSNFKVGKSLYDMGNNYSWPNWDEISELNPDKGKPAITLEMYEEYLNALSPMETYPGMDEVFFGAYNEIIFWYEPAVYTIYVEVDPVDCYGTVSVHEFTVNYNDVVTVDDVNVMLYDVVKSVATPFPEDDAYQYFFSYFSGYINQPVTQDGEIIYAHFDREIKSYVVNVVTEGQKGTVDVDYYMVEYGTVLSTAGNILTVSGYGQTIATPAPADAQYTYFFDKYTEGDVTITKDWTVTAHFHPEVNKYVVNVVTEGQKGTVDVDHYLVDYGTKLSTSGNILTVAGYGKTTATPAPADMRYTYAFINYTEGDVTITSDWTVTAHFAPTAIPYSVVVKYMCNGAPILKDGVDIRVNSQGEFGEDFTYNYLDNPKFDATMASKYSLIKGYIEEPADSPDKAADTGTITVTIDSARTVLVFEFSQKGAFVQFHRQDNPIANPVYETPEPYGEKHTATVQAKSEADAGKTIQILITDDVTGNHANGTFIKAGQTGTYHGYTYKVNQLPKNGAYDAVEVVIDGGLNVHDDVDDPLVIWYQLV
jgi:hypothetical protein